jgi:hypothetical protein
MLYIKERIEKTAGLANRPDGGVVIRGYSGNVCKTERGIKYLGKRMARWLLHETLHRKHHRTLEYPSLDTPLEALFKTLQSQWLRL